MANGSGYDLHYAHKQDTDDGRRHIVVVTNRRIGRWEPREARATDYPFSFVEINIDRAGVGHGRLAMAGRVVVKRTAQHIELEDANPEPIMLSDVHAIQDERR
jgi:hypothetical protein